MRKRMTALGMILLCILCGCGEGKKNPDKAMEDKEQKETAEVLTPETGEEEEAENEETDKALTDSEQEEAGEEIQTDTPVIVSDRETLLEVLKNAIEQCKQPPLLDVSDFPLEYGLEIDVKNVFYQLLSEHQDFLYAYEFTSEMKEDGFLSCRIEYMPYRTGNYPDEFEGIEVGSLTELIQTARAHLEEESVKIRITNPELLPGDLNAALSSQAGQGYIFCHLSNDATEIVMEPAILKNEAPMDRVEALQKVALIDELAQKVVDECTNEQMSQMEKARALYAYLTENVVYDYRYYNDFENFSDKARTALGALEDHLAICGGYAQALQKLFEKAGIPSYMESGFAGEDHMWTIAKIEDTWRLFDATFDAGRNPDAWKYFDVNIEETIDHVPNRDLMEKLIQEAES